MRTSFFPIGNIDMAKDYIIDYGSNSNGWYRKWKSGFIEQGGSFKTNNVNITITFIKPFINLPYCSCIANNGDSNNYSHKEIVFNLTNTNFTTFWGNDTTTKIWYACGY